MTHPVRPVAAAPTVAADPGLLAGRLRRLLDGRARVVVGIAGAPGAGKSTLAARLVAAVGPEAALVPMDGFHLAQRVLDERGLAAVKGAPETFDADGFLTLLERLAQPRDGTTVYAPEFRREIEEPVAGAIPVPSSVRVVVTEGNYLLLDTPPWDRVRSLLTEVWFLDTPESLRLQWLVRRHIAFGRSPEVAQERAIHGSDGRNAAVVAAARAGADLFLQP